MINYENFNWKKVKTCIKTAIKKVNLKGSYYCWSYIKNYCDNNILTSSERIYIYSQINKYIIRKHENKKIDVDFTCNIIFD